MLHMFLHLVCYAADTVLKEHIASLPDKRRRAHRKARQSSGTTRMRHKRTSQASKVQSVQSVQPAPSSSSLPLESDQGVGAREGSPVIISNGSSLSRSSSRVNLQDQAGMFQDQAGMFHGLKHMAWWYSHMDRYFFFTWNFQ